MAGEEQQNLGPLAVMARREALEECLVISQQMVSTPDGYRPLFAEEIGHAIMRLLGWGGM